MPRFVVGHQWTNIVLILNDMLIPLRPIPFYSQRYCRDHALAYRTEHDSGGVHPEVEPGNYIGAMIRVRSSLNGQWLRQ